LAGLNSGTVWYSVAANGAITASVNANRIAGSNSGALTNNYANVAMTVKGSIVSGGAPDDVNGAVKTLGDLQTFAFYNTGANWIGGAWSIAENVNTALTWRICPAPGSLPYFQWQQGIVCTAPPPQLFCGGDGSPEDPYKICNAAQLDSVRLYLNKTFILMNDIDLAPYLAPTGAGGEKWTTSGWMPIGTFTGTLHGNGHKVYNLWINRTGTALVGLFGVIDNAKIDSLGVEIAAGNSVIGGNNYLG
jgi:hypothetical protein